MSEASFWTQPADSNRYLNYPGDCREGLKERIFGPTQLRELLIVTDATYDEATDTTRATLRPATAEEVSAAKPASV